MYQTGCHDKTTVKNKDWEILSMKLNINAIETCADIPEYMSTYGT